ncbi:PilZ domain-containing protein [Neisseria chenwenguii]|uniref:Pilus assembly protein n=1 Tax=Neisseria chenwenguii TaxID=1853278 RepID=A0A220S020_9NEIS|nr:pilus assembly protein [Neisseria chenwenguii]ROV53872.1 pilus assembly protein [Neisseria chenwenguii]
MENSNIPGKMMSLQLKEKVMLYNCYMPFLENGGLFVPSEDVFSLGDEILLAVEIGNHAKRFLPTKVAFINPARTSAHRPKGVGLAFTDLDICIQTKNLIEAELGNHLRDERATFTL